MLQKNHKILFYIRNAFRICLIILLFKVVGCSSPRQVQISISSSNDVNYGGNPVVVRVYQLKSAVNFQRSSLESFWDDDIAVLGGDLLGEPFEILLRPDDARTLPPIRITDDVVYLAAAADFYQPDRERWRDILDIREYAGNEVFVLVGNNRLAIRPPR